VAMAKLWGFAYNNSYSSSSVLYLVAVRTSKAEKIIPLRNGTMGSRFQCMGPTGF
jgi:hypothetical protein